MSCSGFSFRAKTRFRAVRLGRSPITRKPFENGLIPNLYSKVLIMQISQSAHALGFYYTLIIPTALHSTATQSPYCLSTSANSPALPLKTLCVLKMIMRNLQNCSRTWFLLRFDYSRLLTLNRHAPPLLINGGEFTPESGVIVRSKYLVRCSFIIILIMNPCASFSFIRSQKAKQ